MGFAAVARNIVFLGPPGCGKGTYARLVCNTLHLKHISTGDELRTAIAQSTLIGKEAQEFIDRGDQVPQSIMEKLVAGLVKESGFILDGYPRTVEQAKHLSSVTDIHRVIHITMRDDLLQRKLAGRRVCPKCGISWNTENIDEAGVKMPPYLPKVDEGCGECSDLWVQRSDDTPDIISHRLRQYHELEGPILDFYAPSGLVHRIDIRGDRDVMLPEFLQACTFAASA